MVKTSLVRIMLVMVTAAGALRCSEGTTAGNDAGQDRVVRRVPVDNDQSVVVSTSTLSFRLQNTDRIVADSATVTLSGVHSTDGRFVETYPADIDRMGDVGDIVVKLDAAGPFWDDIAGQAQTSFQGQIVVELSDALGVSVRGELDSVHLDFVQRLAPFVEPFSVGQIYAGQRIQIGGAGFLRPSEGQTVAVIETGDMTVDGAASRAIDDASIPVVWAGRRDQAYVVVDPGVFGVQTGSFSADLHLENRLDDQTTVEGTQTRHIEGQLQQSYLAQLSPSAASRGQIVEMTGRGLVETDDAGGYGMVLRYEGRFVPDDSELPTREYTAQNPLRRPVEVVDDEQTVKQSVWYTIEDDRTLSGLGATPGVFEGTITPELFDAWGQQQGVGWEGQFRVLPTRQVVYLKYLPAFSEGLEQYGLRNVERDIRDRILEVVRRDYDGINVAFREDQPDDFRDYAVVEIGGPDPSGHHAFGYDNTFNGVAKDTGNLFLADYLGGVNAQSGEEFNNPYGGIFIESFSFFSRQLNPESDAASDEFDRIMAPFMPALDGQPIKATEWPAGARQQAIAEAIHMVGSVVGNTITHELGHSLGLTYVPGDDISPTNRFHNRQEGPHIMDPGSQRPFVERGEIGGHRPARFNARNRDYLERILPRPSP